MVNYEIIQGDCIQTMKGLPAGSVQTCVTSPPYYGLRDYQTATWDGGDAECDHVANASATKKFGNPEFNENRPSREATKGEGYYFKDVCGKCGARRIDAQVGLEETPGAYVAKLVDVFREVRRLLRDDGTLWLNLGDSYFSPTKGDNRTPEQLWRTSSLTTSGGKMPKMENPASYNSAMRGKVRLSGDGLKPKDLIGIPWMVAFALRADGWWLRSDIIWHKLNPMPESVKDRPTKAHEYIFLLSKAASYYYDADAIKESNSPTSHPGTYRTAHKNEQMGKGMGQSFQVGKSVLDYTGRNRRSVWTVTTKPYSGAHFATFPPDLIEPCILAGSKAGDTVLDPFAGSGTTLAVAMKHGRNAIGCELNSDYIELAHKRIGESQPVLLEVTA